MFTNLTSSLRNLEFLFDLVYNFYLQEKGSDYHVLLVKLMELGQIVNYMAVTL